MRDSILETRGTYKGHKWGIIFRNPLGYRCGYVEAPQSLNPLKTKLEEDLDVHGGVTYIEHFNPLDRERTPNFWIGFDCAHAGDGFTSRLFTLSDNEEVRSKEYCVEECKKLIDQLIELEAKVNHHASEKEANN